MKHFTIGITIILIMTMLSGCEEKDKNIQPPNNIRVALKIEVLSEYLYNNVKTPNAGSNVRIQVTKNENELLNDIVSTDSIGMTGAVVPTEIIEDEKIMITASLVDKPEITASKEITWTNIWADTYYVNETKSFACNYDIKITLPVFSN